MRPFEISIAPALYSKCPSYRVAALFCMVENGETPAELLAEMEALCDEIRRNFTLEHISAQPRIAATREAYRACGKKPARYRPAAEALYRRVVKGDNLPVINAVVDVVNLVSLRSGYSIGAFDVDTVQGDVVIGIGEPGEDYEGIGRGDLNIHGLPTLRDGVGGIGTPTSDTPRTAISHQTTALYMNINGFDGGHYFSETISYASRLLTHYASAGEISVHIIEK